VVAAEDEHVIVDAEGARFRALRTPGVREGDRVTLSLRPEMIRLADAGDGWPMRVGGVIFLGRTIRYDLLLPSGTRLTVDRPAGEPIRSPGDAVVASWDPESPVAIAGTGAAADREPEPDLTGRSA
jgi:ABC-type Fe3+/spermidine/putrescine transport system ATPase subunit